MFGAIKFIKNEVSDRTVYMEVFGGNRIYYRVTSGKMMYYGQNINVYGIEVEDTTKGECESISDFSHDIEDAVDFAEMLIADKAKPSEIYSKALDYLRISI